VSGHNFILNVSDIPKGEEKITLIWILEKYVVRVEGDSGSCPVANFGITDGRSFVPCYVGPCQHGMARPRVEDRAHGFQIWTRVAANILNK
jgi:hypothetical protein